MLSLPFPFTNLVKSIYAYSLCNYGIRILCSCLAWQLFQDFFTKMLKTAIVYLRSLGYKITFHYHDFFSLCILLQNSPLDRCCTKCVYTRSVSLLSFWLKLSKIGASALFPALFRDWAGCLHPSQDWATHRLFWLRFLSCCARWMLMPLLKQLYKIILAQVCRI